MTDVPQPPADPEPAVERPAAHRGDELAVRQVPSRVVDAVPWAGGVAALRAKAPQLARHPAVVATAAATATLGTRLALHLLDRLLDASLSGRSRAAAPLTGSVVQPGRVVEQARIVQHVSVVHHVVHHVVHYGAHPAIPPWPITPRSPALRPSGRRL